MRRPKWNGEVFAKWDGLWWRLPGASIFTFLSAQLFIGGLSSGGVVGAVIFATASLTVAATFMAPVFSLWLAKTAFAPLAGLFYPDRKNKRPPAVYGPAEALRADAHYEEAIQAYEAILAEHPGDARCYLALMDIAWRDMGDARRAMNYYHLARGAVKDEEYLEEMRLAYEDFAPYLQKGNTHTNDAE
jgi:tetratricopeptide (TPR) repeat protein